MKRTISSLMTVSIALSGLLGASGCDHEVSEEEEFLAIEERDLNQALAQLLKNLFASLVRIKAHHVGLEPMPAPPEVRPELFELGQALAFDKILSGNENISCMTCHHPLLATDDDLQLSIGEGGVGLGLDRTHPQDIFIPRNAPGLFNLHDMEIMFWDGRVNFHGDAITPADEEITPEMLAVFEFGAASAQAMFPVTSRREMRGELGTNEIAMVRDDLFTPQWESLMRRLATIADYVDMFEAAYPGTDFEDMTFAHAANALAGFEIAAFPATDTPWDRFLKGDNDALSWNQLKGAALFMGRGNCVNCHNGTSFSDFDFHNTAMPQFGPGKGQGAFRDDDLGRGGNTNIASKNYHFRTPPLRNISLTGPFGHAGQFVELEDFIAHYIDPETSLLSYDTTQVDPRLQDSILDNQAEVLATFNPGPVVADIAEYEVPWIAAFLEALTDEESLDLEDLIPESVPSGLPVDEIVVTEIDNVAGSITFEMGFDTSGAYEYQIWEPSMCEGSGQVDLTFDRNAGTIDLHATFDGLPYRPTYCYDFDPSTPWNQYPECVEDGRWQMWFVGHFFTLRSNFYYDMVTGDLIGHEQDLDLNNLPPSAFPIEMPTLQMLCSPFFESDPETLQADFSWSYDYHQFLDMLGSGGVYVGVLPPNIFDPSDLVVYYTEGGLPPELAIDFDDVITDIAEARGGMMAVTSYEPFPKPAYLAARDNVMIGWGGSWPTPDPNFEHPVECGTNFQWEGEFGLVE